MNTKESVCTRRQKDSGGRWISANQSVDLWIFWAGPPVCGHPFIVSMDIFHRGKKIIATTTLEVRQLFTLFTFQAPLISGEKRKWRSGFFRHDSRTSARTSSRRRSSLERPDFVNEIIFQVSKWVGGKDSHEFLHMPAERFRREVQWTILWILQDGPQREETQRKDQDQEVDPVKRGRVRERNCQDCVPICS